MRNMLAPGVDNVTSASLETLDIVGSFSFFLAAVLADN